MRQLISKLENLFHICCARGRLTSMELVQSLSLGASSESGTGRELDFSLHEQAEHRALCLHGARDSGAARTDKIPARRHRLRERRRRRWGEIYLSRECEKISDSRRRKSSVEKRCSEAWAAAGEHSTILLAQAAHNLRMMRLLLGWA